MSLLKLLGAGLTVWNLARRRIGPVGGFVVAAGFVASYVYLKPWLTENAPIVTRLVE